MNSGDFCRWVQEIAQSTFGVDTVKPLLEEEVVSDIVSFVYANVALQFNTPKTLLAERVHECLQRLNKEPLADLSLILALVDYGAGAKDENDDDDDDDDLDEKNARSSGGNDKDGDDNGDDKDYRGKEESKKKGKVLLSNLRTTFQSLAKMLICVLLHAPTPAVYARCRALLARYTMPFEDELQNDQLIIDAIFEHSDAHLGYTFYEVLRNLADLYARKGHETLPLIDGFEMTYNQLVDYARAIAQPSQGQRMLEARDYGRIIAIANWQQRVEEPSQRELRALIERVSPGAVQNALRKSSMSILDVLKAQAQSSLPEKSSLPGKAYAREERLMEPKTTTTTTGKAIVCKDGTIAASPMIAGGGNDQRVFDADVDIALRALALLFEEESAQQQYTWPEAQTSMMKHRLPLLGVWHRSATSGAPVIEQATDSLIGHKRDAHGFDICVSHYLFAIVNKETTGGGSSTTGSRPSSDNGIEIKLLTGPLRGQRVGSIAQMVAAYGGLTTAEKYAWQNGVWSVTDSMEVVLPSQGGWCPIGKILRRCYNERSGGGGKDALLHQLAFDTEQRLFAEEFVASAFEAAANAPCSYDATPIGMALQKTLTAQQRGKSQSNRDKSKQRRVELRELTSSRKDYW